MMNLNQACPAPALVILSRVNARRLYAHARSKVYNA